MGSRRGNSIVEFTFVGIGIMFVMISTFEMSRGMWLYYTLAESVREGARWAAVNGQTCAAGTNSCTCPISGSSGAGNSIDCVARTIAAAATGIPPGTLNTVTITTLGSTGISVTCAPLNSCYGNTSALTTGIGSDVKISAKYQFFSALSLLWPGSAPVHFGAVWFTANSHQLVQY